MSGRGRLRGDALITVALAGIAAALVATGGAGCSSTGAGGPGTGGATGGGRGGPSGDAAGTGGGAAGPDGGAAGTGGSTAGAGGASPGTGGSAAGAGGASPGTGGAAAGRGGTGGSAAGAGGSAAGAGGGAAGTGGGTWRIPVPTTRVRAIAVGGQRACAIATNGVARCWGRDTDPAGLMLSGDNGVDRAAPVDMTPLLGQHVVDVALTSIDLCALKDEGSVFCNGMYSNQLVSGIGGPTVQICAGSVPFDFGFGCALRADGKVFCWGDSSSSVNPLGDSFGAFSAIEAPGLDDAIAVACGVRTACAVKGDGTAWCWGSGWGTQNPSSAGGGERPRLVPELGSDVAAVKAGEGGICGFSRAGAATCFGALFTPMTFPVAPPRAVPELNGARAVAIGDRHVCSMAADGAVRCWGANDFGQLADGTFVAHAAPALATALGGGAGGMAGGAIAEIAAGEGVTCASLAGGAARCAGNNDRGTLGDGSAINLGAIPVAFAAGASVASFDAADAEKTASAVLADGSVVAWGAIPSLLAPPAGSPLRAAAPVRVAAPPAQPAAAEAFVTDVSACLRAADGAVRCLQTAPAAGASVSFDVVRGFETGAIDLDSNCAAPAGGGVKCGLGLAGVTPYSAPGSASAGAVASIAFGFGGGCLRRPDGNVECWPGAFSNIGAGTQAKTKPVGELGGKAVAIAVGDDACALREDGVVVCWRMDEYNPLVAARVPLPAAAVGITAGSGATCQRLSSGIACYGDVFKSHVCAWTGAGDLYCWGGNQYGQLGDGTIASRTDAVKATAPGGPVLSAAAGNRQTCALLAADRRLVCWGWNGAGELGAGTGGPRATATAVALP